MSKNFQKRKVNSNKFFSYDIYTENYEGFNFVCLADKKVRVLDAYEFLKTLKVNFFKKYTLEQAKGAVDSISYKPELEQFVKKFESENPSDIASDLSEIKKNIEENLSYSLF